MKKKLPPEWISGAAKRHKTGALSYREVELQAAACDATVAEVLAEVAAAAGTADLALSLPVEPEAWPAMLEGAAPPGVCVCPICRTHSVAVSARRVVCAGAGCNLRLDTSATQTSADALARQIANAVHSHAASACGGGPLFAMSSSAEYTARPPSDDRLRRALQDILGGDAADAPDLDAARAFAASASMGGGPAVDVLSNLPPLPSLAPSVDDNRFLTMTCGTCGALQIVA